MGKKLKCKIGKVVLKNPVIAASGTFGYGKQMQDIFNLGCLGGFVTKTITQRRRQGNKPPRIYDLGFGVVNSIGLENPGIDKFKQEYLSLYSSIKTNVFVSIYGEKLDEWKEIVSSLDKKSICGFELNLSCPNIGGEILSADKDESYRLVSVLRQLTRKAIIAKLSFSPQIKDVALSLQKAGIDAVTAINTLPAIAVDAKSHKPVLGNVVGGLSGPCIKPVALRAVYELANVLSVPVIGSGGIMNFSDTVEFLSMGAKAVQIGTATLVNPRTCQSIAKRLNEHYG